MNIGCTSLAPLRHEEGASVTIPSSIEALRLCPQTGPDALLTLRVMISFCEEDYAITMYICEFFNTLTNLAYGT